MIIGPNAIDGEDSHFRVVIGDYSHCVSHTTSLRASGQCELERRASFLHVRHDLLGQCLRHQSSKRRAGCDPSDAPIRFLKGRHRGHRERLEDETRDGRPREIFPDVIQTHLQHLVGAPSWSWRRTWWRFPQTCGEQLRIQIHFGNRHEILNFQGNRLHLLLRSACTQFLQKMASFLGARNTCEFLSRLGHLPSLHPCLSCLPTAFPLLCVAAFWTSPGWCWRIPHCCFNERPPMSPAAR